MGAISISSGFSSSGITLSAGGTLTVSGGGTANRTVDNGGVEYILSGGITNSATVNAGGVENVSSGGVANHTVVNSGGSLLVQGGGFISGTLVNSGGSATISSGGSGAGTGVRGGVLIVAGADGPEFVTSGGVSVLSGGTVGTASSGTTPAIYGGSGGANVLNAGTITSTDAGVWLNHGGVVVNSATISGRTAAVAVHSAGSGLIGNAQGGTLIGGAQGVFSDPGATVTLVNSGTIGGTASGGIGVVLNGGGTIVNFGTIYGTPGPSRVAITGVSTLVLEGGSVISGSVQAAASGGVLELAGDNGAGSLSGIGTLYTGFRTLKVDSGANWTLSGGNTISGSLIADGTLNVVSGGSLVVTGAATADTGQAGVINVGSNTTLSFGAGTNSGLTVSGFSGNDTIDLTGLVYAPADTVGVSGSVVTVTDVHGAHESLTIAGGGSRIFVLGATQDGKVRLAIGGPAITAVATHPSVPSPLNAGKTITFTLTPSSGLTVNTGGGTPVLTLSDGGVAAYSADGSTSTSLKFIATVAAGDSSPDLKITGLHLRGGSITDVNGLALDATSLAVLPGSNTGIVIDTRAPAAPTLGLSPGSDSGTPGDGITNVLRPTLTGTAEPRSTVTLANGNVAPPFPVGTAVADALGNWSFTPATDTPDGTYSVVATATDPAGNVSALSAPLAVTIDSTPPHLAITGGAVLTNVPSRTVSGTDDTAEAGRTVTVFDNTTSAGTATVHRDGSWQAANIVLAEGANSLIARETDVAGNTGSSAPVLYTLDTVPPTVTAGLADDTGASDSDGITSDQALTGTAEPNRTVTISNGATVLGTTSAHGDGHWSFKPQLGDGTFTLTVSQTDAAGNTGSGPVTFTLDRSAPGLSITPSTGPTNVVDQVVSGTLTGGEAGDLVTLQQDGPDLGTATTDGAGSFRVPFTFTGDGTTATYNLKMVATDIAGNSARSSPFGLTLDFNPNLSLFGAVTQDATSPGGETDALYMAILGRPADAIGEEGGAAALAAGASPGTLAQILLTSQEYVGDLGDYTAGTDDAFVRQIYHAAFGRVADNDGVAGWDAALANGASRPDVAASIALSQEGLARTASNLSVAGVFVPDPGASNIARLYYGVLGRAPDGAGLAGYSAALHAGSLSLPDIAGQMLSSPEAAGLGADQDAAYVTALYQNALGRAPDDPGLAAFTNALANGTSRAMVATSISDNPEAIFHQAGKIELGYHLA